MMNNPVELPLRDYHLPTAVSWWPPAPGWWVLLLVGLLLLMAGYLWRRRWLAQGWRRAARRELDAISTAYVDHADSHRLAGEISVFLRRVCITRFPGRSGAQLNDREWLCYLDMAPGHSNKGQQELFDSRIGQELLAAAYNRHAGLDGQALVALCRSWLQRLPAGPWWRR